MSILDDELRDLEQDLEDSEGIVEDAPGPLPEPERSNLETKLDSALTHADNALTEINSAGSIDPDVNPSTLPAIADECVTLAAAAKSLPDTVENHAEIGTKIKTIKDLINRTDGYKDKPGITA